MTVDCQISAESDVGPLEKLAELVKLREKYLKTETTANAVTATAINVVTSLKAETKKAPIKAQPGMYTVEEIGVAGWRGGSGNRRRRAVGYDGHHIPGVWPVNEMYGLKGNGKVFRITITNPKLRPTSEAGSKNPPVYLIMAPTIAIAEKYAKARVTRALQKESGMARYALGIAQAKVSDRPMDAKGPSGAKQMQLVYNAAQITKQGGDGTFSIEVNDALDYSMAALAKGTSSFDTALMKAANRTAAIINNLGNVPFGQEIPTPFPEVTGGKK